MEFMWMAMLFANGPSHRRDYRYESFSESILPPSALCIALFTDLFATGYMNKI